MIASVIKFETQDIISREEIHTVASFYSTMAAGLSIVLGVAFGLNPFGGYIFLLETFVFMLVMNYFMRSVIRVIMIQRWVGITPSTHDNVNIKACHNDIRLFTSRVYGLCWTFCLCMTLFSPLLLSFHGSDYLYIVTGRLQFKSWTEKFVQIGCQGLPCVAFFELKYWFDNMMYSRWPNSRPTPTRDE